MFRYPPDSDTESSSSSEEEVPRGRISYEGQAAGFDAWNAMARNWTTAKAAVSGVDQTALGVHNTVFEYEESRVVHTVMVDSLDRDQVAYPLPTSMRLKLPRVYRNVERIDIVQIKFLNGIYAISPTRGNATLPVEGTTVTIPAGTYTPTQLCIALQAALSTVRPTFSVSYNSITGRITIADPAPFTLPFRSTLPSLQQSATSGWGLGWVLGFGGAPADLTGAASYTASTFPRPYDDYIFLRLNQTELMNTVDHTALENIAVSQDGTGQVGDYFGKLLLSPFGCWAQTFIESPKCFRPILGRLDRLAFDWVDRHGAAIAGPDAASCDWHMTLRITEITEGQRSTSSLAMSRHGGQP
jgi:hypothetical protein